MDRRAPCSPPADASERSFVSNASVLLHALSAQLTTVARKCSSTPASRHRRWLRTGALLLLLCLPTALGLMSTHAAGDFGTLPLGWEGVVRQSQPNTCGPAVIATLLLEEGRQIDDLTVAEGAELGPTGITLAGFTRLADRFGLAGEWYSWPATSTLPYIPVPSVVHLEKEFGHFALLQAVTDEAIVLSDPARGNLLMSPRTFLTQWSRVAYVLAPRGEGGTS